MHYLLMSIVEFMNAEKIKIKIDSSKSLNFQCIYLDQNQKLTEKNFLLTIFDNVDELRVVITNITVNNLQFLFLVKNLKVKLTD